MPSDLHIHMILDGADFRAAINTHRAVPCDDLIRSRLADYHTRGITLLRDGGDAWGVSLRAKALAPEYGIDYRSPAFPIYKKGHYGSFIGKGFSDWAEYAALLREVRASGGDFVKLMISGLIDFSHANTLTEDGLSAQEIHTMVRMAKDMGFAVMVHANGDAAVAAAIDAGVDSIEHGAYIDAPTLERLAESGILWVPTLATIGNLIGCGRHPDEVLQTLLREQQKKAAFVAAHGGLVGLGSDAGAFCVYHGQAVLDEYSYLSAAIGKITDEILIRAEDFVRNRF